MKNTVLMISLGLAIVAGGAVASNEKAGRMHHGPHHNFEDLDANGDGKLMQEELAAHMQAKFEHVDADGDGVLTKAELLARGKERKSERAGKFVDRMIKRHDADGDGALTLAEMSARHQGKMFTRMDTNQDGAVTRAEFDALRAKHKMHKGKDKGHKAEEQELVE